VPLETYLQSEEAGFSGETLSSGEASQEQIDAILARADPEVREYGALILSGVTPLEAGRKLCWSKKRAHRIDVRYRGYMKTARQRSDFPRSLAQLRLDASKTVQQVPFNDPSGERRTYWEPRPGWKTDPRLVN
jgi:hypothetical protein